ncbi:MAG: bis(5'-nucleosyl)-tetraphosphatase (symmetrical) YqeK [Spirochaetales bacterium]|nr:bis(5'-nucleosyl)-tetraphosphatase (symmetrical) YqeK [Spirochaetales bacterium]
MNLEEEIKSYAKKKLTESRFHHTIGCANEAKKLAYLYGEDIELAYIAGLLHDIERETHFFDIIKLAKDSGYHLHDYEMDNPIFLHGAAAVTTARRVWGIENKSIFDAIRHHTLGEITSGRLGYILYIADFIEPSRLHVSNEFRSLVYHHDEKTMLLEVLEQNIKYSNSRGQTIYQPTYKLYNYLKGAADEKAR